VELATVYEDASDGGVPSPSVSPSHPSSPPPGSGRRHRYGRQRGAPVPGSDFRPRLGPASPLVASRFNAPMPPDAIGLEAEATMAPEFDTPIDRLVVVSVDCETTGQSPHHLVELGAVRFTVSSEGGEDLWEGAPPPDALETLVHTTDHINSYARRVHGITRDMLAGAPPADLVLRRFLRFARGAVLVEHSADAFDTRLIGRTLGHPLPHPTIDTSRLAKVLFGLRDTIGLERLCERLGVTQHRQAHHALADAEATAGCFVRLVQVGRAELGWATLGDLHAAGHPPGPRLRPAPTRHARLRHGPRPAGRGITPGDGLEPPPPTAAAPAVPDGEAPAQPARRRRRRGGRGRGRAAAAASPPQAGEPEGPAGGAAGDGAPG